MARMADFIVHAGDAWEAESSLAYLTFSKKRRCPGSVAIGAAAMAVELPIWEMDRAETPKASRWGWPSGMRVRLFSRFF